MKMFFTGLIIGIALLVFARANAGTLQLPEIIPDYSSTYDFARETLRYSHEGAIYYCGWHHADLYADGRDNYS